MVSATLKWPLPSKALVATGIQLARGRVRLVVASTINGSLASPLVPLIVRVLPDWVTADMTGGGGTLAEIIASVPFVVRLLVSHADRKRTRLNSSHLGIS